MFLRRRSSLSGDVVSLMSLLISHTPKQISRFMVHIHSQQAIDSTSKSDKVIMTTRKKLDFRIPRFDPDLLPRSSDYVSRTCDCCEWPETEYWHLCLDCDFSMCDECFKIRHVRNPGHSIGRRIRARSEPSASSNAAEHYPLSEIPDPDDPTSHDKRPCCPSCLNYTPDFIEPDWNGTDRGVWSSNREPLVSEFKDSAARGCDLCSIIYRGLLKTIPDALTGESVIKLNVYRRMLTASVLTPGEAYNESHYIQFHAMPGHHPRWCTMETAEALSRSLSDQKCFDQIRKWLKNCETTHSHPRCRQKAETTLPRRVVTIRPTLDGPKLYLNETNSATGKYIALSHCWGGFTGCQSTTANLAERLQGIEYEELPQTFKDAIYCALQLNIQHIWIDSLCIIQDDVKDWERESAKMSQVYSDAYLVIAAASADADDKGFFTEPDSLYRGIGLESREGSGTEDIVMHKHMPRSGSLKHPGPLSPINLGPLGRRACTMQETLLARRCVGFTETEIAWECHSVVDCECHHTLETSADLQRADWIYGVSTGGFSGGGRSRRTHTRPLTRLEDVSTTYMEWRLMLIPNYTRRGLTFADDKLPALSALANIIAESSGDECIAGIWRADLNIGLAWRAGPIKRKERPLPAPNYPAAPSFSWASIDGPVQYYLPDPTQKDGRSIYGSAGVNLIGNDVPLSSPNRFGAVRGGWIKISALSQTFDIAWDATENEYKLTDKTSYRPHWIQFDADTILHEVVMEGPGGEQNVFVQRANSSGNVENWVKASVEGVLILDIPEVEGYTIEFTSGARPAPVHEIAMMVLSASPTNQEQFQRIGLATAVFEAGADVVQGWLDSAKRGEFTII